VAEYVHKGVQQPLQNKREIDGHGKPKARAMEHKRDMNGTLMENERKRNRTTTERRMCVFHVRPFMFRLCSVHFPQIFHTICYACSMFPSFSGHVPLMFH